MHITYYPDLQIAVNDETGEEAYNVSDEQQAACIWGSDISIVKVVKYKLIMQ